MADATYDVLIVGGGIVGATLALTLAQHSDLTVAVIDANTTDLEWTTDRYHHRVSAITAASQRILQSLGVWQEIASRRVSPFQRIEVWRDTSQTLVFDSREVSEHCLGFIVENNLLLKALRQPLQTCANVNWLAPVKLTEFSVDEHEVKLTSQDGVEYRAKLAVAADGAYSWLRQAAGIQHFVHDYTQAAIVATVTTEKPHLNTARQCFLAQGPLAFLPLAAPCLSSIVWTLPLAQAEQMMQLDEATFRQQLTQAFAERLGEVVAIDQRFSFPLKRVDTAGYIANRVALVGDAAHVVHPLAGQGVNIGILDAAALAQLLVEAYRQPADLGARKLLRRYERWRKTDNLALLQGIDVIKHVFSGQKQWPSFLLNIVNGWPGLRGYFTRHAVGKRDGLPSLTL